MNKTDRPTPEPANDDLLAPESSLDWLLEPGTREEQKAGNSRRQAAIQRAVELQAAKNAWAQNHYPLADSPLPWKPQAQVFILFRSRCRACGEESTLPETYPQGLPQTRLVRFEHKRTGQIWEKPCLIEDIPRSLSKEVRYINSSHAHCPDCLEALVGGEAKLPVVLPFPKET